MEKKMEAIASKIKNNLVSDFLDLDYLFRMKIDIVLLCIKHNVIKNYNELKIDFHELEKWEKMATMGKIVSTNRPEIFKEPLPPLMHSCVAKLCIEHKLLNDYGDLIGKDTKHDLNVFKLCLENDLINKKQFLENYNYVIENTHKKLTKCFVEDDATKNIVKEIMILAIKKNFFEDDNSVKFRSKFYIDREIEFLFALKEKEFQNKLKQKYNVVEKCDCSCSEKINKMMSEINDLKQKIILLEQKK